MRARAASTRSPTRPDESEVRVLKRPSTAAASNGARAVPHTTDVRPLGRAQGTTRWDQTAPATGRRASSPYPASQQNTAIT